MSDTAIQPAALWSPQILMEERPCGTVIVRQAAPLEPYPPRMNDRLLHWAAEAPDRIWMAQRDGDGWATVTYAEAARAVAAIAQGLLDRGLSQDRPLLILSGNSIAHALMALAAQHVGIPSAAIAPAYALVSTDYGKLRDIAGQLTPGMIFAEDATPFAPAIEAVFGPEVPVASVTGTLPGRDCVTLAELRATPVTEAVDAAFQAVGPDTVAKFLFTSGTTGSPKAVIQTQRMLCSNQEMIVDCYAFLRQRPPVVVDWAPWNHTASGNKVFNLVLYNGGTYYIDDGKPTPKGIAATIRNLREISPSWYFNVPVGYQMLLDAMETDDQLRRTFFRHLSMMMYAGAGMSQPVWDRLTAVADQMVPGGVLLATGFGSTETGPFALMCTERQDQAGNLGVPARGVVLKLVPQGDKLEARVKSPSVTPGYWRNEKLTAEAFDEEGFYRFGDALRFAAPGDPERGFIFDGRLAENFKLDTGTWVAVGPLRAAFTNDLRGLASDVVIAGENRASLAALVVPDWSALRALAGEDLEGAALLAHPRVRDRAAQMLADHARRATGSSTRVTRMMFLEDPLEFDRGEVTDKGSINQRAVLRHRDELVQALYNDDPRVILPAQTGGE
ncbi:feruloyl-CoA synthase [Plastorhodobacter daqingensis]|uniref:Feruloyl-CoA synthase n=1 Tax=Plastorhodobacter daqingensis TaxID=1387281 RepID=A0ABW2UIC0_9RHOB